MGTFVESWFWAMMQFFVVFATLIMIYRQVRTQTASHVVSTINSINARWNSESLLKARFFYCQKWIEGNSDFDPVGELIAEVLEEVATIVRIRAVPKKVIWETHSWYIEHYYSMFKEGIEFVRKECNEPALFSEIEWLCGEMQKISEKKQSSSDFRTEDELKIFAKGEFEVTRVALFLKEDGFSERSANKSSKLDARDQRHFLRRVCRAWH